MINNEEHNDLCVGIDLGTTNSVLATINVKPNGDIVSKVVSIPRAVDSYSTSSAQPKLSTQKKPTLPSCIYYREERNYEPLVGDFAKMQYHVRPHLVAKSIKSQMGKPLVEGLSPDIPDKTPAQVSSRILEHLLNEAKKIYHCKELTDVVITVPANFDSAMCQATLEAAQLAGVRVKNRDGSQRHMLLSEPNAVIYDLINQINNGEISNHIIDLSEKKNVLVFDFGGGTLDITMHEIKRREDCPDVLKVKEIATNRYTLLGGDDFDELIAKNMFENYKKQYKKYPDAVRKIEREKQTVMPTLLNFAEQLKIDVSENNNSYNSGWGDEEDFDVGGNMGGTGYAYDDTFTKEQVESILSVFMAYDLKYDDYKRINEITSTRNIIYPILDVLNKASKVLDNNVKVDAVIVNGGMSKFYMVTNRLTEFFGFEPIIALDPDQAVARGAAVFHYYLHKYDEIKDDMLTVKEETINTSNDKYIFTQQFTPPKPQIHIEWGKNILNDSLYIGLRNGAVQLIIPSSAELPYQSEINKGFRVEANQNMINIPIKSKNIDGSYRTIAKGNIFLKQKYNDGAFVAFTIYMESNKIITMNAWTSETCDCNEKLEECKVSISINNNDNETSQNKAKIIAPKGSELEPKYEINNILQLCKDFERNTNKNKGSIISKNIRESISSICNANNKQDFSSIILQTIPQTYGRYSNEALSRLFYIARKLGESWTDSEKARLAKLCMAQIHPLLEGFSSGGKETNVNIQALYTLSICASEQQLKEIKRIHNNSKYLQVCLYIHAKTKTELEWIYEQFHEDIKKIKRASYSDKCSSNLQISVYAIGVALRKDDKAVYLGKEEKIVDEICSVIMSGKLKEQELICSVLALGWICDQRNHINKIGSEYINKALDTIRDIDFEYNYQLLTKCVKSREVATKMINGDILTNEEEMFLLTKLEI